jgi:hypothetical protein
MALEALQEICSSGMLLMYSTSLCESAASSHFAETNGLILIKALSIDTAI